VLLAILDGGVDELRVLGLLGRGEDERGVRGRILRLVLVDGRKVARVADDGLMDEGWLVSLALLQDRASRWALSEPLRRTARVVDGGWWMVG
jgi:hypothetical protein